MSTIYSFGMSLRGHSLVAFLTAMGCIVLLGAGCGNKEAIERPVGINENNSTCEATLLGCDVDKNGVRDDIQQQIDAKYPSSTKSREALYQDARALQSYLSDDANDSGSRNAKLAADAVECMEYVLGMNEARSEAKWLETAMFNSEDRIDGYLRAQKRLNGAVSQGRVDLSSACTFKPNELPN